MLKHALFFTSLILIFVSCGSLKTETWINADGSGKRNLHFDMGELMKEMKSAMEGFGNSMAGKENNNNPMGNIFGLQDSLSFSDSTLTNFEEKEISSEPMENTSFDTDTTFNTNMFTDEGMNFQAPKTSTFEKFFENLKNRAKIDTIVNMYSLVPDSIFGKLKNPELIRKTTIEVHADSVAKTAVFDILTTFKNFKELDEITEEIKKAQYLETKDSSNFINFKNIFDSGKNLSFDSKGKKLISKESKLFKDGEMSEEDLKMMNTEDDANLDFFLSLMGLSDIETVYHLPKKIESVSGDAAYTLLDEKTVKISIRMKDCIKKNRIPGYVIKFK